MNPIARSLCSLYLNKEFIMLATIGLIAVTYLACKAVRLLGAYVRSTKRSAPAPTTRALRIK